MVRKHDPDAVHLRVRIDGKLLRRLEQAAKRANRSLNNEVVTRLDGSFRVGAAEIGSAEEQRLKAMADQMAEMRHELDAIKLRAGPLDDEEIERRRQLSIKANQPAAEWLNELCREITKAIEERRAATPEEDATGTALDAIQRALSMEPDRSAETEQPTDRRASQKRAKS